MATADEILSMVRAFQAAEQTLDHHRRGPDWRCVCCRRDWPCVYVAAASAYSSLCIRKNVALDQEISVRVGAAISAPAGEPGYAFNHTSGFAAHHAPVRSVTALP